MNNRVFCFVVALLFLFVIPNTSMARIQHSDKYACGKHLTWSLNDEGLLVISGFGEMYSYVDHAPWDYFSVKNVILEDGVTSIGSRAFSDCYNMKGISIPESVTKIGDYAFSRCYRIKEISLPDHLFEIGANPFVFCTSLENIKLSSDHQALSFESGILSSKTDHRLVCRLKAESSERCNIPEGTQIIGDYAFSDCNNLQYVSIPEGVSLIGDHAFSGCSILIIRDFPKSLTSVGNYAFSGCKNLGYVRFGEGLKTVGDSAFSYCWYLQSIEFPDTLTTLGKHPFDDCRCLSEIRLNDHHKLLGVQDGILYTKQEMKMIFYLAKNNSETYSVPQGIAIIGERAFSNAGMLKKIILPSSVREIEKDAFWICNNVKEIAFSKGLETINERAFYDMVSLKEAMLPDGVLSIGDEAFAGCSDLEKVLIPASVERIGDGLFDGTDILNLAVFIMEGSEGESYCRQNALKAIYPGQEIPDPEVNLPWVFTEKYPKYRGVAELFASNDGKTNEAVYLAKKPDGMLVLLCGTMHENNRWTIIESTPLPEASRVVLYDGLVLLDLGFARCTVRRYYDDIWGIDYTGWREIYAGPKWIGYYFPTTLYYGAHSWGDLAIIRWETVTEDFQKALRNLDVSKIGVVHANDPDDKIPMYTIPDADSEIITYLIDSVPMNIIESNQEWTKVSIGRDADNQWKLEGWIYTGNLLFPKKANINNSFRIGYNLYPPKNKAVMLITPSGNEKIENFNDLWDTWMVIGEKNNGGKEYWLFYECNTEQVGFVLKEELYEPNG